MKKKGIVSFLVVAVLGFTACSIDGSYEKLDSGAKYKFIEKTGGKKATDAEVMLVHMENVYEDSVIMKSGPNGLVLSPKQGPEIMTSAFALCGEGDSIHIQMPLEEYAIATRMPLAKGMDGAKNITMKLRVVEVINRQVYVDRQQREAVILAERQVETDRDIILKYADDNNLEGIQTEEGLFYVIEKQGKGRKPNNGERIRVDYTVRLLDGTFIDSSSESLSRENSKYQAGRPYGPYAFKLGAGAVIDGWDLAFGLLNEGTKAKLLVPSGLAYGLNPRPGGGIPPNAVLLFDVELVEIED